MATREGLRARLYRKLADLLGADEAVLLMPPRPWEQIATKADVAELGSQAWKIVAANVASSAAVAGAVVAAIGRAR